MSRSRLVSATALLLLLVTGACAQPPGDRPAAQPDAVLVVRNDSWLDMTVYVIAGGRESGQRSRLGLVTGTSTATFRLPRRVVGMGQEVSFVVDPVGSSNVATSYRMFVRPGEELTLRIPSSVR
ncbi:MAG TPA: hypothetical protein VNP72_04650 [Longimicrobium sp.]|nr:hypothetical protein [Longimicrobium sp.]